MIEFTALGTAITKSLEVITQELREAHKRFMWKAYPENQPSVKGYYPVIMKDETTGKLWRNWKFYSDDLEEWHGIFIDKVVYFFDLPPTPLE